ncbi:MAG: Uncharacterized protein Athens101410_60 [Parcubacteria group bacterium Athens1014_10]|nr:MAG: Uncharacterized protein Athens101410_60 [Parcubacteria group bacterium Athens1014_10]TSD06086.1 MAG: Uncharacterized protein Athens071412_60 [Parcubacteria group bacterium Athens0714_12]
MPKEKKTKLKTSNLYPYKKIVNVYLFLTVILIISIFYLISSKALVLIIFEPEKISSNFIIQLGSETNLEKETIKSEFAEEIIEKEETFSPKSETMESKASGEVTIINNYGKNQPLVATTRLLSPEGFLFRTAEYVMAPAGGKVKVKVKTDQEGQKYEIGPSTFTIPGLWEGLQDKIYGQSFEPMKRNVKKISAIIQEDIDKAKEKIKGDAVKEVLEKIKNEPKIIKTEILEEFSDSQPNEEKENFKVKLKIKIMMIDFSDKSLEDFLSFSFKALIPQEKKLLSINKNNLTHTLLNYDSDKKSGKIKVSAEGNFAPDLELLNFPKDKLVGLTEEEVKEYLKNFTIIKDVKVELKPFWLKTMPLLSDKIEIKIMGE